jgi:uncharacterized protein (DUF2235 family)
MGKNIVICCDGTGNEVVGNPSNVLKLFRILQKNDKQCVYYHPGIGTVGADDAWARISQNTKGVFGLASGYGLDDEILGAYTFLAEHYHDGDCVFLFGFSRGAYTARALAGFIHVIGLLPLDQLNIANYALSAYKKTVEQRKAQESDAHQESGAHAGIDLKQAWQFGRVTNARRITIDFLGVWDTVASMIVPRWDRAIPIPTLQTLPYTRRNSSVKVFRHAKAIDERRRFFRLNRWQDPQDFIANPFAPQNKTPQDIKQVWFAGVHADVGGGYEEECSGLSKYPLNWMIDEAVAYGLLISTRMRDHIALGHNDANASEIFVAPDSAAELHDSMTTAWKAIEWIPKRVKYEEWKWRLKFDGFYVPSAEPRPFMLVDPFLDGLIEKPTPRIHQSVVDRIDLVPTYRPINLPPEHDVEPWPHQIGARPS